MSTSPSPAIKYFGTEEPVTPMRTLHAGPLTAEFDQGALRFIKVYGKEAIRNLAFVVRDKDWGTYNPALDNLNIEQSDDGFEVSFDAVCKDAGQELHYHATISGSADGTLRFTGTGKAISDFVTNRTGFVVLHPVVGVSGYPVEVERVDGSRVQSRFPQLVDPIQPFKDLRALTHQVLPGVSVSCRMEGDTFEMEDHRQWGDASYKTYVRPIGQPWPFTIEAGDSTEQSVTLTVHGRPEDAAGAATDAPVKVSIGAAAGTMPRIGLGLEPQHSAAALQHIDLIKQIAPQIIVCWHDLRAGHGSGELGRAKQLAEAVGAELVLEAVIPCDDYKAEIALIAAQARQAELRFAAVSFSPSEYLRSFMPGSPWPALPELEDIYDAARAAFPNITIGGGMFSFFPELNRKRPPTGHLDYISHTSNVITHACDDITVTENLEALPFMIQSCRAFAGGKPYRVGPSAIAMRFNPYGAKTMDNPHNVRIAMARMDPRQRGLINSAWTLGYVAHMARGGLEVITLQAPVGEFGLIYHKMNWSQLWFDDHAEEVKVYPAFHVVAAMAAAAGSTLLKTASSFSHDIECIAWQKDGKTSVWLANLTGEPRRVSIDGLPADKSQATLQRLDAETFEACVKDPAGFAATAHSEALDELTLAPYAVVRIDM